MSALEDERYLPLRSRKKDKIVNKTQKKIFRGTILCQIFQSETSSKALKSLKFVR